jgi:lipid-binding SYLF domain-containing protein
MRLLYSLVLSALLSVCNFAVADADDDFAATVDLFAKSPQVQPFFANAYGYAVFPLVGKGGFVVGGSYGEGRVYRGREVTGRVSLVQLSVGFQAGGQAFSQIVFFQDERAYDEFTSGSFEFDATASAVAITAGAQARTGTTGQSAGASAGPATGVQSQGHYVKGMAVFVHIKGGLMYEAAIGGQKFNFEPY